MQQWHNTNIAFAVNTTIQLKNVTTTSDSAGKHTQQDAFTVG